MSPKEKAKELVDECYSELPDKHFEDTSDESEWRAAKKLALVCANTAIAAVNHMAGYKPEEEMEHPYWKEVKQEINKL